MQKEIDSCRLLTQQMPCRNEGALYEGGDAMNAIWKEVLTEAVMVVVDDPPHSDAVSEAPCHSGRDMSPPLFCAGSSLWPSGRGGVSGP